MRKSEDAGEIWNLSHDVCWQTWLSLLEVILKLFCGKGWLELKSILWVIRLCGSICIAVLRNCLFRPSPVPSKACFSRRVDNQRNLHPKTLHNPSRKCRDSVQLMKWKPWYSDLSPRYPRTHFTLHWVNISFQMDSALKISALTGGQETQ